jgi:hypothetical protein
LNKFDERVDRQVDKIAMLYDKIARVQVRNECLGRDKNNKEYWFLYKDP